MCPRFEAYHVSGHVIESYGMWGASFTSRCLPPPTSPVGDVLFPMWLSGRYTAGGLASLRSLITHALCWCEVMRSLLVDLAGSALCWADLCWCCASYTPLPFYHSYSHLTRLCDGHVLPRLSLSYCVHTEAWDARLDAISSHQEVPNFQTGTRELSALANVWCRLYMLYILTRNFLWVLYIHF